MNGSERREQSKIEMKKDAAGGDPKDGFQISFSSYGVDIGIRADTADLLAEIDGELEKINPNEFQVIDDRQATHLYEIKSKKNNVHEIFKDGELINRWESVESFLPFLQSQIRLTIAEYADSRVFLHAGAVAWKGRAIIIPARSFTGKSTLVHALVKKGAAYYSDDFAVLDGEGLLHPFHRDLSLRGFENKYRQVDFAVEALGGSCGSEPLPCAIVLLTGYREGNKNPKIWKPKILSAGRGVLEMLSHTIPIRYKPKFSLEVLNKVTKHAIICKSQRGEALEFADLLLDFIESKVIR